MKKSLRLIWIVLTAMGCLLGSFSTNLGVDGAGGIGDTYYPTWGNGGYDVTQYLIIMEVDPLTNAITASTTITANATEKLKRFNLDFTGLTIDSILVNNQPAKYILKDEELRITPAQPLEINQPFTTVVKYHGNPEPFAAGPLPGYMGWDRAPDGTINVWGEPNAAPTWFPDNDHPRDKATYRFEITVPKPWVVAASGSLKETIAKDDKTLYIWEMNQPMATYLASINIGKYELVTASAAGGVTIRNYYPEDFPASSKRPYQFIPLMLEFFSRKFGPYPFSEYGVVVASEDGLCASAGMALEAQTLSIHCPTERMGSEEVIAHELAHQWFGDSVSLKNWQDVWLKEGLATYASWLWAENRDARAMTAIIDKTKNFQLSTPIGKPPKDDLYRDETYLGGAHVFHALRLTVGDDTFFKILQTYHERYRYGVAGTNDFIAVANEVSGQDLNKFFDDWLYGKTLPEMPTP